MAQSRDFTGRADNAGGLVRRGIGGWRVVTAKRIFVFSSAVAAAAITFAVWWSTPRRLVAEAVHDVNRPVEKELATTPLKQGRVRADLPSPSAVAAEPPRQRSGQMKTEAYGLVPSQEVDTERDRHHRLLLEVTGAMMSDVPAGIHKQILEMDDQRLEWIRSARLALDQGALDQQQFDQIIRDLNDAFEKHMKQFVGGHQQRASQQSAD